MSTLIFDISMSLDGYVAGLTDRTDRRGRITERRRAPQLRPGVAGG
jgi:hypothetical protein